MAGTAGARGGAGRGALLAEVERLRDEVAFLRSVLLNVTAGKVDEPVTVESEDVPPLPVDVEMAVRDVAEPGTADYRLLTEGARTLLKLQLDPSEVVRRVLAGEEVEV